MDVTIVTPSGSAIATGNWVTARRIEGLIGAAHSVTTLTQLDGGPCDTLIAIHAFKSETSIVEAAVRTPKPFIVLILGGTDVYSDRPLDGNRAIELSDKIVALNHRAIDRIPADHQQKVITIVQSAHALPSPEPPLNDCFELCVCGHLRDVKDPFRAAYAARLLSPESNIRITHLGRCLDKEYARQAMALMESVPHYRWEGEKTQDETLRVISRSRGLIVSSLNEGGANVVSEAIMNETPVLASDVDGNIGLLGEDYGGYYPVGDTTALFELLVRFENENDFRSKLLSQVRNLQPQFTEDHERKAWLDLLAKYPRQV